MSLFIDKRLRASNSEDVRFSGGFQSLEKFWYEVSVVSSSPALIIHISLLHKSSRFMSRNNNWKGNKNSEYSVNPGPTKKQGLYTNQFIQRKIKDYPIRVITFTKNIIWRNL